MNSFDTVGEGTVVLLYETLRLLLVLRVASVQQFCYDFCPDIKTKFKEIRI